MREDRPLAWRKLWDFLGHCSEAEDSADLFLRATRGISSLVPCDQAFASFVELQPGCGPLVEELQASRLGRDGFRTWMVQSSSNEAASAAYLERYFYLDYARNHVLPGRYLYHYDWRERRFSALEFAQDFVLPILHADATTSLSFYAEDGRGGVGLVLARTGSGRRLRDREAATLAALQARLARLYDLHRRARRLAADRVGLAELAPGRELLSPREVQVAELICERQRTVQIAALLCISPRTVERHIEHIYEKLGVNCRRDMVRAFLGVRRFS